MSVALKECENTESSYERIKYTTWTAEDLAAQYPVYVKLLSELETTELEEFLKTKRERFFESSIESLTGDSSKTDINVRNTFSSSQQLSEDIVNALCHPDVVNKVVDLLLSS